MTDRETRIRALLEMGARMVSRADVEYLLGELGALRRGAHAGSSCQLLGARLVKAEGDRADWQVRALESERIHRLKSEDWNRERAESMAAYVRARELLASTEAVAEQRRKELERLQSEASEWRAARERLNREASETVTQLRGELDEARAEVWDLKQSAANREYELRVEEAHRQDIEGCMVDARHEEAERVQKEFDDLRAQLAKVTEELERAMKGRFSFRRLCKAEDERDAALARAEKAEKEARKALRTCPYCGFDGSAAETLHWPGNHNCPHALSTPPPGELRCVNCKLLFREDVYPHCECGSEIKS